MTITERSKRICPACKQPVPLWRHGSARYCSKKCQKERIKNHYKYPRMITNEIPTGTVGAVGELKVAIDLLSRGFEVYRNLSPHGSADLITIRNNEIHSIEVRSGYRIPNGTLCYSKKHKAQIIAVVIGDEIVYEPKLY